MRRAFIPLLFVAIAAAQDPTSAPSPTIAQLPALNPVRTTVGMIGHVAGVVLPGSEFEPIETTPNSNVVVRIEHVQKHGSANRYDLEFTAFEKGDYDLASCLRRKDRSDAGPLPKIPVVVTEVRNQEQHEPNALSSVPAPKLGGYSTWLWLLGSAWVAGLVAIAFVGKKRARATAPPPKPITLADRLRPLVAAALLGSLAQEQRAELERLLLSFWRDRLQLQDRPARDAIRELRNHPEAGVVLRALEQWLHRRAPEPVDVESLLRPYAAVGDDDGGRA